MSLTEQDRKLGKVFIEERESLKKLETVFSKLGKANKNDIIRLLNKREEYIMIPASVFKNELSPLENVVLYLDVKIGFNQIRIARLLKRDHTTIWTTLENAKKKMGMRRYIRFVSEQSKEMMIPLKIFSERRLSVLENAAVYLRKLGLSYHETALVLGKDDRTIWTVVDRARRKC